MASSQDLIDKNIADYKELEIFLQRNGELTFLSTIQVFALKSIILSIASHFETRIIDIIHVGLKSNDDELLKAFIEKKALERQYHQLFDWEKRTANKFFAYFGSDFKNYALAATKNNQLFSDSMSAFLELGEMRNKLVHVNYITFPLELTISEIEQKWQQSKTFPSMMLSLIAGYRDERESEYSI